MLYGWNARVRKIRLGSLLHSARPPIESYQAVSQSEPLEYVSLSIGAKSLSSFGIKDGWKRDLPQPNDAYRLFLKDVVVHSDAGIVHDGHSLVIEDTLDHTGEDRHFYKKMQDDTILFPPPSARLRGRWLSLLLGNNENYFHFLLLNINRLFLLQKQDLSEISGILLPCITTQWQRDLIDLVLQYIPELNAIPHFTVQDDQSVSVEELLLLWHAFDDVGYGHSEAIAFASALMKSSGAASDRSDRIYIDRRSSTNRKLVNEDELVGILETLHFEPVKLENLSVQQQILKFSRAKIIISPHGAGLSNLIFCRPKTNVLEIMPNSLMRWVYRHISLIKNLHYDCVISKSAAETSEIGTVAPHIVAIPHILSYLQEIGI